MDSIENLSVGVEGGDASRNWMAYVSLGLGVVGLCVSIFPGCSVPIGIGGVILGVMGRSSDQKVLATIGLALSTVVVLLFCAIGTFGVITALIDPIFVEGFQ